MNKEELRKLKQDAESLLQLTTYPEWSGYTNMLQEDIKGYKETLIYDTKNMEEVERIRGVVVMMNRVIALRDNTLSALEDIETQLVEAVDYADD